MPCDCCQITDKMFGEADARSGLRHYQRRGPSGQTRELLNAVRARGITDATLLDIGGGIGVIHHELLGDSASQATEVDASGAFLKAAEAEAARRGHSQRVSFVQADFTDVASDLPPADIVTLDRVVCCYPDFQSLLTAAAGRSTRLLAMTYPRERWYMRAVIKFIDGMQALRRDPFRVFVHPVAQMDAVLNRAGMRRVSLKRLFVWEIALYERV
jgi:SAM-dependent methyltransferase